VEEGKFESIRSDFYQTTTQVIASIYLKGIKKDEASIKFNSDSVDVDLRTADNKHYVSSIPLYGQIIPDKSTFRIITPKLEFTLAKSDGSGWPVLRSTDPRTGEIIQSGRAGTMK